MVLKLNTGRCVSEEAEPQKEVDTRWCASKDVGLEGGELGVVPHRLKKGTSVSEDAGP